MGHLVLIGGDEDKRGDRRLLARTLGQDGAATVAVIPTASRFPARTGRRYVRAYRGLGIRDVHVVDVRKAADADRPKHLARIDAADVIFFTGGDQSRLVRVLGETKLVEAVRRAWERGATIAGTSAGAAAAGDPMIFDGQEQGLVKGRVRHDRGFGFLPGTTVDTHFVERSRFGRLAQFLASGMSARGIGLSENTALVVGEDGTAEVAGAGAVVVMRANGLTYNDYQDVEQDQPVSMAGLELGFLSEGKRFDVNRWCVIPQ